MRTVKIAAIFVGALGFVAGIAAAYFWLESSKVPITPPWGDFEPLETDDKAIGWALAASETLCVSAALNKRAAQLTAISVLLNTLAGILGVIS